MAEAIRIIELFPMTDFCCVCGDEVVVECGLAMYEDLIVPEDWPGEWGGFTACRQCYGRFTGIKVPLSVHEARKMLPQAEALIYPGVW